MCLSHPWSFSGYAASSSSQLLPFLLVPAPGKVESKQGDPHSPQIPLQVDQSGLGLPSRDYYLNKTENEKVSLPSLPRSAHPAIPKASETWLLQRAQFPEGQQAALGRLWGWGGGGASDVPKHPASQPGAAATGGNTYPFSKEDNGDSCQHLWVLGLLWSSPLPS